MLPLELTQAIAPLPHALLSLTVALAGELLGRVPVVLLWRNDKRAMGAALLKRRY